MVTVIPATKARNKFFDILNAVIYKGEEFVVEKSGEGRVKIVPEMPRRSPEEIKKILANFRKTFAKSAKIKYWSVMDTPAWKKKDKKYLERLSKGIID